MSKHLDKLILHVDVDAFFASVEQLLIPALRNRPVIVGSGCIASCSYEARAFGLHAGMSLREARRFCPSAVVLDGQYPIYRCFAEHVWQVCRRYTRGLETYLDEACGDATGMEGIHGDPLTLGRKLQREVREQVGLPVSVGLASNRMMAKFASGWAKPGGVAWIRPGQEEGFLAPLPIEKLPGVGGKTAQRLRDLNVKTIGDLRPLPRDLLGCMFGRRGELLYERCRGGVEDGESGLALRAQRPSHSDDRAPRKPAAGDAGAPKTISRETTFHQPQCDPAKIRAMLAYLTERAMRTLRQKALLARTVRLSIRYDDRKEDSAERSLDHPTAADDEIFAAVSNLLDQLYRRRVALRHVGILLSRFSPAAAQAALFEPPQGTFRPGLYEAIDTIRDRWGHAAVVKGQSIDLLGELKQNDYGFVLRTPSLTR